MAAKKKKRRPSPLREQLQRELMQYVVVLRMHEQRRSDAAERSARALEVIAQYVADYATRDRVQRMLGAGG